MFTGRLPFRINILSAAVQANLCQSAEKIALFLLGFVCPLVVSAAFTTSYDQARASQQQYVPSARQRIKTLISNLNYFQSFVFTLYVEIDV